MHREQRGLSSKQRPLATCGNGAEVLPHPLPRAFLLINTRQQPLNVKQPGFQHEAEPISAPRVCWLTGCPTLLAGNIWHLYPALVPSHLEFCVWFWSFSAQPASPALGLPVVSFTFSPLFFPPSHSPDGVFACNDSGKAIRQKVWGLNAEFKERRKFS